MGPRVLIPGSKVKVTHEYAILNGVNYRELVSPVEIRRANQLDYLLAVPSSGRWRRTIFLMHGWPDISYGWRNQFEPLTKLGLRVIAPDCIGYGRTEAPDVPPEALQMYSFKRVADDMAALAGQLGVNKIILGGHDWGGAIVYRIYMHHPELVTHIFSICVPYDPPAKRYTAIEDLAKERFPNFRYQVQFAGGILEREFPRDNKERLRAFLNGIFGGRGPNGEIGFSTEVGMHLEDIPKLRKTRLLSDEELEYYVNEYSNSGLHGPCNWYRTRKINFDDEREFKNPVLDVPVLFIGAEKDGTIPPDMYAQLGRVLPNLTLRTVNTQHWAMVEDAAAVNEIVTQWITETVFAARSKY